MKKQVQETSAASMMFLNMFEGFVRCERDAFTQEITSITFTSDVRRATVFMEVGAIMNTARYINQNNLSKRPYYCIMQAANTASAS